MFELILLNQTNRIDITPIAGNISWSSSIEELGQELSFEVAYSDMPLFPSNPVDLGYMVVLLKDQQEVLRTIVIDEGKNGRSPIKYTTFDAAFYLNKSTTTIQFNNVAADKSIRKILQNFGVPIGSIVTIPTRIDQIFANKKPSDIIREIMEIAESDQGIKYRFEMRQGKFHLEKQTDLLIEGVFDLSDNVQDIPIQDAISNPSRKRSLDGMRNSIQAVKDEQVVLTLENQELINDYGLLQDTVTITDENEAQIRNITNNKLDDLAKIMEENSLDFIGDVKVRAGRLMDIKEPITGLSGRYVVQSVNHTFKNGVHLMSVDVEGYK